MKFIIHCIIKPEHRNQSMRRLKEHGVQAPNGAKVLSRWHSLDSLEAWAIVEAVDEITVAQWLLAWTDLNINTVTPVLDSKEVDKLLAQNDFD